MARTITDIKAEMAKAFMAHPTLMAAYGFSEGAAFDSEFSKVSVESILLYIVAAAIYFVEVLFDTHKAEIDALIDTKKPHRKKWYRDKALSFQFGDLLVEDSDTYAVEDDSKKVVKFAAAVEYQGRLFIKVAGGSETEKAKLPDDEKTALDFYFSEIKDAGIIVEVVNLDADHFSAELDIYYNPMLFDSEGNRFDGGATVAAVVKDYVQNQIPFNGEYRNANLIDALQKIDGVIIPELKWAKTAPHEGYTADKLLAIEAKCTPVSGYFKIYNNADLVINHIPYQNAE